MMRHFSTLAFTLAVMTARFAEAKLSPEQIVTLPPPASRPIDFSKDIKPIFEASCIKCHGRGKSKGDFRLDTRETLLSGGQSGPAVVPARSVQSYLIELVSGLDPDNVMPQKGSKLTREQVGLLRAWIDQGLPWDEGVSFGRIPPINLHPRKPELPVISARTARTKNPIDLILRPYFAAQKLTPDKPVSDPVFARRVYLDVLGLLPPRQELEDFVADRSRDKRQGLVKRLLAEDQRYAEHWLSFWNDVLRNDYKGTGYIDNGRKQITGWLYAALAKNMPYDRFVAELINPTPESEGFVNGIVWRGAINASQTPQMQAAQNISQVFMGVNLKCASCHDSFINDWALADAYGLASIYATNELEMVQCDKPTGKKAAMKFLYPELGAIDTQAPKSERIKRLAEIITQKQNGRLSRTIVNRLWAKFMGRGLVEPVDDMETPAWHPDLLDWLAEDLVENGYDLKKTMERILTSEAYQMPAVPVAEQTAKGFAFRGPFIRRMSAEQYTDALASVTGHWFTLPAARSDFAARQPNGQDAAGLRSRVTSPLRERDRVRVKAFDKATSLETASDSPSSRPSPAGRGRIATGNSEELAGMSETTLTPQWIWKDAGAAEKTEPRTVYFRKVIELSEKPTAAAIVVACDNSFRLYINGKEAGSGRDHTKPNLIDIRSHLEKGRNVIAIAATNDKSAPNDKDAEQSNPAGLLVSAYVRSERTVGEIPVQNVMDFASDASWVWSTERDDAWQKGDFADEGWLPAAELGEPDIAPWRLGKTFSELVSAAKLYGHARAALVNADPLMVALGRPNREQVITTRSSVATTLQTLELTNGPTLAERLKQGAEKLLHEGWRSANELVVRVYERALSRKPSPEELRMARDLVGSPARKEGVEDLLWAMTMLPEFQLIY
jgi:mono/diheme cytochrome c family protein